MNKKRLRSVVQLMLAISFLAFALVKIIEAARSTGMKAVLNNASILFLWVAVCWIIGFGWLWMLCKRRDFTAKTSITSTRKPFTPIVKNYKKTSPSVTTSHNNNLDGIKQSWISVDEADTLSPNPQRNVANEPLLTPQATPNVVPDQNAFLHAARQYFLSLQAAFNKGDLEPFRDWLAPEFQDKLLMKIRERGQTEILTLNANVLKEKAGVDDNWVTVRFNGITRENPDPTPKTLNEAWHFKQSRHTANDPWKLARIDALTH
ncbi:MAG: Tim44-like domain-containing protein [Pseudomonadota bacterium]